MLIIKGAEWYSKAMGRAAQHEPDLKGILPYFLVLPINSPIVSSLQPLECSTAGCSVTACCGSYCTADCSVAACCGRVIQTVQER